VVAGDVRTGGVTGPPASRAKSSRPVTLLLVKAPLTSRVLCRTLAGLAAIGSQHRSVPSSAQCGFDLNLSGPPCLGASSRSLQSLARGGWLAAAGTAVDECAKQRLRPSECPWRIE